MGRASRAVLWIYIAFNLLIAATLVFEPAVVDASYNGGAMTPTRRFQWFSIASFHLVLAAMTVVSMSMPRAVDRRKIHLINAGFYLWDAATQLLYWGSVVGLTASDLYTNCGVSAVVGLLLVGVWWKDRDQQAVQPA